MPSYRPRRYTPHGAAVLAVLTSDKYVFWSAKDVADEAELAYGTVRTILRRFWSEGLADRTGDNQSTRVLYRLSERGRAVAEHILRYMPDPVEALTAWLIHDHPPR